MSDNYELPANFYPPTPATAVPPQFETTVPAPAPESGADQNDSTTGAAKEKAEAAKEQAGQLKDQAAESTTKVAGAAKDAAGDVAGEIKTQAKDLFTQTQTELKDQAAVQQKRVAGGLRSLSDELGDMASKSESNGVASDLVGQAASRASGIASWLDGRDPGSLLSEVRSYAARKPGTFIAIAAIAGLAAGRLTKNLASAAADAKKAEAEPETEAMPSHAADIGVDSSYASTTSVPPVVEPVAPLYAEPLAADPLYGDRA